MACTGLFDHIKVLRDIDHNNKGCIDAQIGYENGGRIIHVSFENDAWFGLRLDLVGTHLMHSDFTFWAKVITTLMDKLIYFQYL